MNVAQRYIAFWLMAMAAIGALTTLISFGFYTMVRMDAQPPLTVVEIFKYALLNGGVNGVILGTIATIFLTGKYYWSVGKTKLRRGLPRKSKR